MTTEGGIGDQGMWGGLQVIVDSTSTELNRFHWLCRSCGSWIASDDLVNECFVCGSVDIESFNELMSPEYRERVEVWTDVRNK